MKCYLFDENNLFIGEYDAQESPLEAGIYLTPEKSTAIQPPALAANEFAVFNGNGWDIKTNPPESTPIPPTIEELRAQMVLTPAQARVKLASLGMLSSIDIAISALPVDNLTRIYWEYATEFKRNDLTLNEFCVNSLGMSPEQIDTLFVN